MKAERPHLFMLLADDLGYAELNFERPKPSHAIHTPRIDEMVKEGIRLSSSYAFKFCSPSRSALISGRNPIHVNVNNYNPSMLNPADRVSGFAGIPVNMTGLGNLMSRAGYETVFAGKWDAGMATARHTPHGRGFESALGYFHHTNDYWTLRGGEACPSNATGHTWHAYTKEADFDHTHRWLARDGYLAAGDDWISARQVTLIGAQQLCARSSSCRGFTFQHFSRSPPVGEQLLCAFKVVLCPRVHSVSRMIATRLACTLLTLALPLLVRTTSRAPLRSPLKGCYPFCRGPWRRGNGLVA